MNKIIHILLFIFVLISISNNNSYSQIVDADQKWIKVADGLNFPEGPAYDGVSSIYLSNCYGGWITKFSDGRADTFVIKTNDPISIEKTNGLTFGKDGYLYVCEYGKGQILRINKNSKIEIYADGYQGVKFNRPNDLVLDTEGNLYFTDPNSYDPKILDGRIFFIDAKTKLVTLLADSMAFPNGINISPANGKLYVCESAKQKIVRFNITNEYRLTDKEDFVSISGGDPDGIEFDINGNLYAAHFGGKAVYIFSPEGELIQKIETPGAKPTNLEFGGPDYKTLYLTEVETNALYKIKVNIKGKNVIN